MANDDTKSTATTATTPTESSSGNAGDNAVNNANKPGSSVLAQLKPMTPEERRQRLEELRARQRALIGTSRPENAEASTSGASSSQTVPSGQDSSTTQIAPSEQSSSVETNNATPTQTSSTAAPTSIRSDMVEQAVRFLTAPSVQSAPMSKKLEFLRGKGLSEQEIDQAVKKASAATSSTNVSTPTATATSVTTSAPPVPPRPASMPMSAAPVYTVYPPAPPPAAPGMSQETFWRGVAIGSALVAGLGAGSVALIKHYVLPLLHQRTQDRKEDLETRIEQVKSLKELLTNTAAQLRDIKPPTLPQVPQTSIATVHADEAHVQLSNASKRLCDAASGMLYIGVDSELRQLQINCRQDIRSIKGMLLNRRNFPMPTGTSLYSSR